MKKKIKKFCSSFILEDLLADLSIERKSNFKSRIDVIVKFDNTYGYLLKFYKTKTKSKIKTIFMVILFSMVTDVDVNQAAIEVENNRKRMTNSSLLTRVRTSVLLLVTIVDVYRTDFN
ncbi:hypothetical protein BpHYR1_021958 [Brachionus plicatilis]|uniref:Uncharacterized protein n=1 Tax=Brachionus plicatilis TaxID=10195 RepID=A0A3M7PL80_BRAPC|nr:hypothetical protein BpHYR1_021958 [Brachionus plicatilis]